MVAAGFWMLLLIGLAFYYTARRQCGQRRWLLYALLYSIPVPWLASEMGWFVAEFGRQPWAIGEVLPTVMATSTRSSGDVLMSLVGFIAFYTFLLVIEMYLMFKFARLGPSSLHTGRYHHEQQGGGDPALVSQPASPVRD
jgi:cytochrome d ubiquinol oxidase subunit I